MLLMHKFGTFNTLVWGHLITVYDSSFVNHSYICLGPGRQISMKISCRETATNIVPYFLQICENVSLNLCNNNNQTFQCISLHQVPREVLKTEGSALSF